MPSRDLKVTLVGDDRTGGAFSSASRHADGFGSKVGAVGKGMALAFGGAVLGGVVGVGAALVQGARDAASYQQVTDQVAQTIKSTGNAAGVSVEGLKAYAGQLESQSGVDEQLILSGQNVLLTFTNIRNEAGKGNDVFNQTSQAASNLSATMGTDLVSANTLVGKALNDPIKGLTALRKIGVSFNDQQKEQIQTLIKSGDTMGAQKVILAELNKEFGGAAKAAGQGLTGSIARAKDAFQDMFRNIAGALLPKLADLAQFFTNTLMPGIKGIYDLVIGGDFTGALRDAFGWEEDSAIVGFLFGVRDAFAALWPHVQAVGRFIKDNLVPILAALGAILGGVLLVGIYSMVTAFVAFLSPVVLVIGAIAALAAGIAYAYQHSARFREIVAQVAGFLTGTVIPAISALVGWLRDRMVAVLNFVMALWRTFGSTIVSFVTSTFNNIRTVIGGVLNVIKGIVDVFIGILTGDWRRAWEGIKQIVSGVWNVIKGLISQALNVIKTILSAAWAAIRALTSAAWNGITSAVSGAWRAVTGAIGNGISAAINLVRSLPGRILSALGNLGSLLWSAGKNMIQGLIDGAGSLLRNIGSFFLNLVPGWIRGPFESALGIHSPSKVFHGYGQNIGQGLIDGMAGMRPAVASQMTALANTRSLAGLGVASLSSPGVLGAGSPAGRNAVPTVHIEHYNEAHRSPHEIAADLTFMARNV